MARNIKVKIAETEYSILAGDDMMERNLRLAADEINNMLSKYDSILVNAIPFLSASHYKMFAGLIDHELILKIHIVDMVHC